MNRVPKPPIGFVPVDSEEAKGMQDDTWINYAFISPSSWIYGNNNVKNIRMWQRDSPRAHYHVQLPPAVEWEEVWGWKKREDGVTWITYNGVPFQTIGNRAWTFDQLNTIVRALNEKEGQNA